MKVNIGVVTGILVFFAYLVPCTAGAAGSKAGTTGAQILQMQLGARAAGMGGAYAAVADDSESVYFNPAGLATIQHTEIPLVDNRWFEGMQQQHIGIVYSLRDVRSLNIADLGTLGFGWTTLTTGDIPGRDVLGNATGDFEVKDQVITASYGKMLFSGQAAGRMAAGVNAKFLTEDYQSRSFSSQAVDAGLWWNPPSSNISFGAALQNFGGKAGYGSESADLPTNTKIGAAYKEAGRVVLALDVNMPDGRDYGFNAGAEYWFFNAVALRAGYDSLSEADNKITAGFGISVKQMDVSFLYFREFDIEYAFIPYGDLGDTHRVGIKIKLGAD